jgi:hypothetical protein
MQELKQYKQYHYTYSRFGNDLNGNPIYLINVYVFNNNRYENINTLTGRKRDKYENIRMTSYNVDADIHYMIDRL